MSSNNNGEVITTKGTNEDGWPSETQTATVPVNGGELTITKTTARLSMPNNYEQNKFDLKVKMPDGGTFSMWGNNENMYVDDKPLHPLSLTEGAETANRDVLAAVKHVFADKQLSPEEAQKIAVVFEEARRASGDRHISAKEAKTIGATVDKQFLGLDKSTGFGRY